MSKHESLPALPTNFVDMVGRSNDPAPSMMNALIALDKLGVVCSYDMFHDRRYVSGEPLGSEVGQVTDDVCLLIREQCRKRFKFDPGLQHTWEAVNLACRKNSYHPVLDYLDGLSWDGAKRIDTWLIEYAGAPDTPFVRAVSRLTLIAAVRRVRQPGCKFDFMTVFESGEGKNKSKALATLFGEEHFSDQSILGISDKELMENLRGRWGIEAADLSGMRKADVDRVKAQLSRQTDRGRPSYGRAVIDVPRACVMFGTTNDHIYLRSQTGNRRFWPIKVERFDIIRLKNDRDQLWAEANVEEMLADNIDLPEELWADATAEQDARTRRDPWEDILADVSDDAARQQRSVKDGPVHYEIKDDDEERITSHWLLTSALRISEAALTVEHTHRLATVMRKLGWDDNEGKTMWIGKRATRGYKRSDPLFK